MINRLYRRVFRSLNRRDGKILVLVHGYSLAHTLRPFVIGRELATRGWDVQFAGDGPYMHWVSSRGFKVSRIKTMPQERMDSFVRAGNYSYFDWTWTQHCVDAEVEVIETSQASFVISDMRPTMRISARVAGVDHAVIEAAYSQPGYPFPIDLTSGFSSAVGPFEEYLEQVHFPAQENKLIVLMPDVPEFHPPCLPTALGYHYVGPLLLPEAEEETMDADLHHFLQSGNGPIVYATCGSSGLDPSFLEDLAQQVDHAGIRLIMSTAGRVDLDTNHARLMVRDRVPGLAVLKHADILVSVGGIGSIYQALACGRPIVGAAEHLDQEYHLNRVQALGLGKKMPREDFHADGILAALEHVLGNLQEYRRNCLKLAAILRQWHGGKTAATIAERHLLGYSLTAADVSETECRTYLHMGLLPEVRSAISPEEIGRFLVDAAASGLPIKTLRSGRFLDKFRAWNWLHYKQPEFFEQCAKALFRRRSRYFVRTGTGLRCKNETRSYRVSYSLRILDTAALPTVGWVFLPTPLERPWQGPVEFVDCWPGELQKHLLRSCGFYYGIRVVREEAVAQGEFLDFGYTCEVSVRERRCLDGPGDGDLQSNDIEDRWLEVPAGASTSELVRDMLSVAGGADSDEDKARALFQALASGKGYAKAFQSSRTEWSNMNAVLNSDRSDCLNLATTFALLCRCLGIPARVRVGALLGFPSEEMHSDFIVQNETSLLSHTWAEAHIKSKGWVPAEFDCITFSEHGIDENVQDPDLRETIVHETEPYRDYCFGNLDNQHLEFSETVLELPPFVCEPENPTSSIQWMVAQQNQPPFQCRLTCHCVG